MAEGDQPASNGWMSTSEEEEESPPPSPPPRLFIRHTISGNEFDITSKYNTAVSIVGSGAFGYVCSFLNSETGEEVAIKKIERAFCCAIHSKQTIREIKLMRHFDHDNIISMRDVIPPLQRENFDDVYIVYELMPADLDQVIRSERVLSEPQCKYILYQILRGLKYIHSANVVHLDLKPSNILVNEDCEVKICDFGLARAASEAVVRTESVVSMWYRPPEVLLKSYRYTKAIDIWSVGCIVMEMLVGEPFFEGDDDDDDELGQLMPLLYVIGKPTEAELGGLLDDRAKRNMRLVIGFPGKSLYDLFPDMNPSAIDLVEKMLLFDHRERITVEDALAHPYLSEFHDANNEPTCETVFGFDFGQQLLTENEMREIVYQECLAFNP